MHRLKKKLPNNALQEAYRKRATPARSAPERERWAAGERS